MYGPDSIHTHTQYTFSPSNRWFNYVDYGGQLLSIVLMSHEKSQHAGGNPAFLTWSKDRSQTIHKGGQLERRDEGFV